MIVADFNISLVNNGVKTLLLKIDNFVIEKGKITVILGKNGSGKTTFLKSVTRLHDDSKCSIEGTITINNVDIISQNYQKIRELRSNVIRYIFQDPINSFDPVKKVRRYFANLNKNEVNQFLERFNLEQNVLEKYPHELSGGMAQRLNIIHAFLLPGQYIFMDEPTSFLDSESKNVFYSLCEEQTDMGKALVIVTQDDDIKSRNAECCFEITDKKLQVK